MEKIYNPYDPQRMFGAKVTETLPEFINRDFRGNDLLKENDIILIPNQPTIYEHHVQTGFLQQRLVGLIVCQLLRTDEKPQPFFFYPWSLRIFLYTGATRQVQSDPLPIEPLYNINGIPASQWISSRINKEKDLIAILKGKALKVVKKHYQEGYLHIGSRQSFEKIELPALSFILLEGYTLDYEIKSHHAKIHEFTKIKEEVQAIQNKYSLGFNQFIETHAINIKTPTRQDCQQIIQGKDTIKNYHNAKKAEEIIQKYPRGIKIIFKNKSLNLRHKTVINKIVSLETSIRDAQLQLEEAERQQIREQKYLNSPYRDLILKSMDHVVKDHYSQCSFVEVRIGIDNCPLIVIFGKNLDDLVEKISQDVYAYRTLTHYETMFVMKYQPGISKGELLRKIIDGINAYFGE